MNRGRWIAAAAAAAFLVVLIAQFPARWAARALPRGSACLQLGGTLWNGTCAGLVAEGAPVGDLAWTAHPLRLLLGRLSLTLSLTRASGTLSGRVDLGPGGGVTARDVRASLPLDHALLAQVPASVGGALQIDLDSLKWNGQRITAIRGNLDVRGLAVRGESLGDYRVSFPGGSSDDPAGRLEDLGGPLSVAGTLRLTREPGFVLEGTVAPRASASADVLNDLRFLGSPDARGRRAFSMAGTF